MNRFARFLTAAVVVVGSVSVNSTSFADSGDVLQEKVVFDGSELQGDVRLSHDIQQTIYEAREVDSTCTRQVPDGYETRCHTYYENECRQEYECRTYYDRQCRTEYRQECRQEYRCPHRPGTQCRYETVCHSHPYQHCENYPRQQCGYETRCHQVPRQQCEQVPKYRTETYACKKIIQVPVGQERKLLVTADVSLKFSEPAPGLVLSEEFLAKLEGEDLVLNLTRASGKALIFQSVNKSVETGTKFKAIRAEYSFDIVGIEPLLAPIRAGITDLKVDAANRVLKFNVGRVTSPDFFVIGLELKRKKSLGSDPVVFNGELKGTDVLLTDVGSNLTEVSIPLSNLAVSEPLKKATYKLALVVKVGSPQRQPLNTTSIPSLSSNSNLEFKLE